jgi:hypothetical protein
LKTSYQISDRKTGRDKATLGGAPPVKWDVPYLGQWPGGHLKLESHSPSCYTFNLKRISIQSMAARGSSTSASPPRQGLQPFQCTLCQKRFTRHVRVLLSTPLVYANLLIGEPQEACDSTCAEGKGDHVPMPTLLDGVLAT